MSATAQLNAALAGRYRIERQIGQGGMATVYLAHDVRHERPVALKVLSPELAAVVGVERFLAEIRVTANLQHPNLLPLFDSGAADGLLFYVMPYVQGESLRERLQREKQLPIDDAVRIGVAVAGALDYAHRHHVIHRDLKPENILLHEGQPMIADFGIALAISNAGGSRVTQTGISLGTPHYMSPEQATGDRDIDGRSDIYSLGAVVYEMLSGEPPHSGTTAQAVIAKVLTDKPRPLHLSRDTVPPQVEHAVDRALAKLPADRWATAQQFADALQAPSVAIPRGVITPGAIRVVRRARVRDPVVITLAIIASAGIAASAWLAGRSTDDSKQVSRLSLALPQQTLASPAGGVALAMSRDGRTVVYNGWSPSGMFVLYARRLDDLEARAIPSTTLSLDPSISPNGRWVAFNAGTQLYRVPLEGGPTILMGRTALQGCTWLDDQHVVAVRDNRLVSYSTAGGAAEPITTLDAANGERTHAYPVATRDGRYVFFQIITAAGARLGVVDVRAHRNRMLSLDGVAALGMIDDALIYATNTGALMAAPMDMKNLRARGEPVPLNVTVNLLGANVARAALSPSGSLVYQTGATIGRLVIVNDRGTVRPLLEEPRAYGMPRFSPDGGRIAMAIDQDIWIYEVASATPMRLTTYGRNDRPEWTPDGKRVIYRTTREGVQDMWWQPADGGGTAERLLRLDDGPEEGVVSPDGKWLIGRNVGLNTRRDVWYAAFGDSAPVIHPIAMSEFEELQPRISRDGKLVAYTSNESGRYEVYAKEFPGPSGKVQVSLGGGMEPVWGPGRALYYKQENRLYRATLSATTPVTVVKREKLFEADVMVSPIHANYDVAPNGKEFAMVLRAGPDIQVIVIENWAKEVRQKLRAHGD